MNSIMDKKLFRIQKRGINMPIDFTSPYYRMCPKCEFEFMTTNSQDVYCCDKCKDDFNNDIRKMRNQELKNSANKIPSTVDPKVNAETRISNLRILESFIGGHLLETIVALDEFNDAGYDFEVFDMRHDMYQPQGMLNRYNVQIGSFIITYYSEQEIRIENLKNKPI